MNQLQLSRYAAFSTHSAGGNPAGVWIGDALPRGEAMKRITQEVGYSETAFVAPARASTARCATSASKS
ncbi:MAG: PhzF family phenazine biosynthesis protein [Bacteroidota bacterium]